jgi:hypothetical protein
MMEAYVVGMVVPQEQAKEEEDGVSDDIEAFFDDTNNDVVVPAMTDE